MKSFLKAQLPAAEAPAAPTLGALAKRPASLLRGSGDMLAVLDRYLDQSISTSEKRKRCNEEQTLLAGTPAANVMAVEGPLAHPAEAYGPARRPPPQRVRQSRESICVRAASLLPITWPVWRGRGTALTLRQRHIYSTHRSNSVPPDNVCGVGPCAA